MFGVLLIDTTQNREQFCVYRLSTSSRSEITAAQHPAGMIWFGKMKRRRLIQIFFQLWWYDWPCGRGRLQYRSRAEIVLGVRTSTLMLWRADEWVGSYCVMSRTSESCNTLFLEAIIPSHKQLSCIWNLQVWSSPASKSSCLLFYLCPIMSQRFIWFVKLH